jgi:hypothetical protein
VATHLFGHPKVEKVRCSCCGIPDGIPVNELESHWCTLFFCHAMEFELVAVDVFHQFELGIRSNF